MGDSLSEGYIRRHPGNLQRTDAEGIIYLRVVPSIISPYVRGWAGMQLPERNGDFFVRIFGEREF